MAITASRVINEKVSPVAQSFLLTAGEELFAGYPLVLKPADGKVYMITTDGYVCGVTAEGVASGATVKVQTGCWGFPGVAGVDGVDVGQKAYFTDDGAVATISTAGQQGGIISAAESGTIYVTFQYPIAQ